MKSRPSNVRSVGNVPKALVAETEIVVTNTREDNLTEIVERYSTVRRMISVLLNAFVFRSWKPNDLLLDALDLLRGLYAARPRQLPQRPPTAFLKSTWRKLVGRDFAFNRRAYEVAVMMTLCDSLRSGDFGSKAAGRSAPSATFFCPRRPLPHGDKKANWDLLSPIVSMTGAPSEPFCLNRGSIK